MSRFNIDDEDAFFGTLIALTQQKKFRGAWNYLESNIDPNHIRVLDAGILLQNLSNEYGDIGELNDDCQLKRRLEQDANKVVELLL